jgi:prepilin-type N-terminal cleavage/methylation domain-containing protein
MAELHPKFVNTSMLQKFHKKKGGFTLVEIMITVVIIGMLAAIAVPGWFRARKRSQAGRILEDLVQLDHATDEYAVDNTKTTGANPTFTDLRNYLKTGSVLYTTGQDLFGDSYGPFTVDSVVLVPRPAFTSLSDVAPTVFWSPYPIQ